ncbi:MAG: response regulator, partial [Lentisphaeria bacterium]
VEKLNSICYRSRILIIEDQEEDCRRIIDLLTENGVQTYRISTASCLYSGLTKLKKKHYDAVLLDLSLPDSVGFRTLDFMLRESPEIPIIVMTGLGDLKLAERAMKRGAYGYLSKQRGMLKNTVRRLVREAINKKRKHDEAAITYRFLEIANSHHKLYPLLKQVSEEIQRFTECTAIRIRLLDSDGRLETMVSSGFGKEIMACEQCVDQEDERCLCLHIAEGNAGKLEVNITEGGSFFAEEREMLQKDCGDRFSNEFFHACANMDYEAAAIVPVRKGNKIFGICQIAGDEPYMFSIETIKLLERLGARLGDAVRRVQAEQALDEREAEVFAIFQNAPIMMTAVDAQLKVRSANEQFADFSPFPYEAILNESLCTAMGCNKSYDVEYALPAAEACKKCPLPEYVKGTIEADKHLFRAEFNLNADSLGAAVEDNGRVADPCKLNISTTPLTVSHRKLALLYIEQPYQNT